MYAVMGGDQRKIERKQGWEGYGVITMIHGTSFRGLSVEEDKKMNEENARNDTGREEMKMRRGQ